MAGKNDKWAMFKNYMHNELGITKEDIREWINESVAIEARKIVDESFKRTNPETMIRNAVLDRDFFGEGFNQKVIHEVSKILSERILISVI